MKEVYIHVGLPRTATTFLQNEVFPKLKLNYLLYLPLKGNIVDGKNLISDESLAGYSYIIGSNNASNKDIAKRLHDLYPKAKIIVVFREKNKWLKSFYKQFLVESERRKLVKNYEDWYAKVYGDKFLEFKEYENYLKELFDDVLVLHFEEFKKDHKKFVKNICDFIGVKVPEYKIKKVNISFSEKHYRFLRFCDKFPFDHLSNLADGIFRKILK